MRTYEIEISFGSGDSITIEVEAESCEEALKLAEPTYYLIVREED